MRERIGLFGPLGAPQRFAARHGGLAIDMLGRKLGDEARRDRRRPLAVDSAIGGVNDRAAAARACDRDIGEAALLLQTGEPALIERALRWEDAFLPAGQEDGVELQP